MAWQIKNPILVPFDFSEHAMAAMEKAVEIADDPSQVHALHVLPFLVPSEPGVVWGTVDDASRIEHAIAAMAEALPEAKFGKICLDVRLGDPGKVAAQRAEELHAELVIVGSHGRTGLSRMVLGSVAERVTRLAHCPVLVIKLPHKH
ncbi:MAG: universal stress protein [Planctomycetota bacterium]|nr:MAG: universal stress protein [Planctomycetota bacterium]